MITYPILHAKQWIPNGEKSIFTVVIHWLRWLLRQYVRTRTNDKYDVIIAVAHVRVMSQIRCGDVTMLSQKRPSSATMVKSAIDTCFSGIVCSGHEMQQFVHNYLLRPPLPAYIISTDVVLTAQEQEANLSSVKSSNQQFACLFTRGFQLHQNAQMPNLRLHIYAWLWFLFSIFLCFFSTKMSVS